MTGEEAVAVVCKIGRKIEEDLALAEAEAGLRSWRSMPNGGHDPEFMRNLEVQEPDLVRRLVPAVLPGNQPENGSNPEGAKRT